MENDYPMIKFEFDKDNDKIKLDFNSIPNVWLWNNNLQLLKAFKYQTMENICEELKN